VAVREMQSSYPTAAATRAELHEIYESALVDIRPLGAGSQGWVSASELIKRRGLSGVVITAWNPGKSRPSRADNEAANERLLMELKATGFDVWEADGFSEDNEHREPGFIAWGMSPELGCAIARGFNQFAIFHYLADGSRTVVSVDDDLS